MATTGTKIGAVVAARRGGEADLAARAGGAGGARVPTITTLRLDDGREIETRGGCGGLLHSVGTRGLAYPVTLNGFTAWIFTTEA
jgi:hypothetical protein